MKNFFAFLALLLLFSCNQHKPLPDYMTINNNYVKLRGNALGTSYSITYKSVEKNDYNDSIKNILNNFENSLSIYRKTSLISKVNENTTTVPDAYFTDVFNKAVEINLATNGAFDIAASPLFDIWGWGAKNKVEVTQKMIDSLMLFCGADKIKIENGQIVKKDPRVTLNMNAIAKGYSSDIIALFLNRMGVEDYMVEIGGEIVTKGKNSKGDFWTIWIDKPFDGNFTPGAYLQTLLKVNDKGMATSANYRRFYIENGQKYSHTIDPRTGYQAKQNILSATVIAPDCTTADAYATAFMVLGLEKSKEILKNHPELEAYLVYAENEEDKIYFTENLAWRIIKLDSDE